jgi:hypothetical protein
MSENEIELIFQKYNSELRSIFESYKNSAKIIILLRFWLLTNYILFKTYGDEAYIKFLDSKFTNPLRFSFYYEYNFYDNPHSLKNNSSLVFNILKPYFKLLKLIYFGGGFPSRSIFKIFHNRVSNIFIKNLPATTNNDVRVKINKTVLSIFIDLGITNYHKEILKKLPNIFYSDPINIFNYEDKIYLKGAASSFTEFNNLCRLLLINSQLNITTSQHGGGYDCVASDIDFLFGKYELLLSDNFIGWGNPSKLSDQNKYKQIKKNNKKSHKSLYWVESGTPPKMYSEIEKLATNISAKETIKKYISNEIKKTNINFFSIPHPKTSDTLYLNYRDEDQIIRKKAETIISKNDVVIFDHPFASLIYFCASNDISYIIVSSREFMPRFSVQQTSFVNNLIKKGMFFFDDEQNKLSDALKKHFKVT